MEPAPRAVGPVGRLLPVLLLALVFSLLLSAAPPFSTSATHAPTALPTPARSAPSASAQVPASVSPSATPAPAPSTAVGVSASTPSSPPVVGWITPRGPPSGNGSSTGFAPEVNWVTGLPQVLGSAVLGSHAANATGIAVAPGGPVVVSERNGTVYALSTDTLARIWNAEANTSLASGPTVVGNTVYAVSAAGRLLGWDLGSGIMVMNVSLNGPDLGAAPIPYHGELYTLTSTNVTMVNATTGALDVVARNFTADPTHSLALGNGYLYAQGRSALEAFTLFGSWHNSTSDLLAHSGDTLVSDGLVAVAGPDETLVGGLPGSHQWTVSPLHVGTATLLPAAASNGLIFATDGQGPLYALSEASNTVLWSTTFQVTGPPTVVGHQVYVGANVTGIGNGVADLNASTGGLLWFHALPSAVNSTVAVADGVLYALDQSGNLTALGSPPLGLLVRSNRTGAAVGAEFNFTTTVLGGAGAPATIDWTFSDGSTAVGPFAVHAFNTPGPAWASATVLDSEGTWAGPVNLSVTVYPAFTTGLRLDRNTGTAPLWLNATALPLGGSGGYGVTIQVQGAQPGIYAPSSPTQTLELTTVGNDYITAIVTDTAGDSARSISALVVVNPAAFPPPVLTLVAPSPDTLQVLWSAPPSPGFHAWVVNLSIDGGAPGTLGTLMDPNASSFLFTGLAMDSHLVVEVTRWTSFGNFSASASYATPLVAPSLGVDAAAGLPGQAQLSWTLPIPIDSAATWVVNETLPGTTATIPLPPAAPVNGLFQILTAPLPDLATTTFQLQVTTADQHATSAPVGFSPLVVPPSVQTTGVALGVEVSWNALSFPDFSAVRLCYGSPAGGLGNENWSCPVTNDSPVGHATLSVPAAGTYDVNVTVLASNGFSLSTPPTAVVVPGRAAATAWYDSPLLGVPFWFWVLFVLTLMALLLVGERLYRERRGIPPYTGEVMPWDPLSEDPEPRARPKDPDTLRVSTKIHRHRDSHTHRHGSAGGSEDAEEEDAEERGPMASRLKRPAPSPSPSARRPRDSGEEEGAAGASEGSEEEVPARRGPAKPRAERTVHIDEVGEPSSSEGSEAPGGVDGAEDGELTKLPVVLRHRDSDRADREEEPSPTPRAPSPAPRRPASPSPSRKGDDDEDEDEDDDKEKGAERSKPAPPPPRRPVVRPKPENDEPTL